MTEADPVCELDHARRTGSDQKICPGLLHIIHLTVEHLHGQVIMGKGIGAGAAAAPIRLRQFTIFDIGQGPEDLPGLLHQALPPGGVAGVMIGGDDPLFAPGKRQIP
jgi:hypothetical protein